MGGLAGVIRFRGDRPDPAWVGRMSDALAHRGPDGSGAFAEGPVAVAHRQRRLRPGAAAQPCVTGGPAGAARGLVVMLDGWIYEHARLGAELGGPPDLSDTEVLALAWERLGPDALPRLEGEFAIAVWDRARRRLALVRDRLGVRPLHHAGSPGGDFAFASEVPALLGLPFVSREPDRTRLAEFLAFQVVHAPRTMLRDVFQVEPGHLVEVDEGGLRSRPWWRLRYAAPDAPVPRDAEVVERLQPRVDAAVRKRLPTDVPTGLFLSGGLGSSAIAVAARHARAALPGFTVSLADDEYPETPFAGRVARLLGVEQEEITVSTDALVASFDTVCLHLGQPIGHPGAMLQAALAHAARKRVRVVLSGDGSEELFGGRILEPLEPLFGPWWRQRLPRPLRKRVSPARILELGFGGADLFDAPERARLLRDPSLVRADVRRAVLEPIYAGIDTDAVNLALHGFLRSSLVEGALARIDRLAGAEGLDVRLPLLDRDVVEAAAALPGAVKRAAGTLRVRWPMKGLLEGALPPSLLDRPKRGIPIPLGAWLAGPGHRFLDDRVERLREDPYQLWRGDALEALRRDATRSNAAGNRLWSLFLLDGWLRSLAA